MTMELQRRELEKLYARTFKGLHEDTIVEGRVVQVREDGIIVDLGYKCEGFVPLGELMGDEHTRLKAGDVVPVYIIDTDDSEGFIRLSRQRAEGIKAWSMLEEALSKGQKVDGRIIGKVKGGMTVEINGLKAFLPRSHIDIKPLKDTDHLIGQTFSFKVIKLDNAKSNVIVSRRLLLEEERSKLREETLKRLKEGALVKGTVKNLTDYGAFIDLGGVDGLLHISDMSWGRISHPAELFRIGDTVEVVVLTFDQDSERVTLGYKQKKPDPWSLVEKKYIPGQKVIGKVVGIADYGIFLELEEGVEGLVHVSEIDWTEKVKRPSKYFAIGDIVEAMLLNVNKDEKRISLSIKQLKPNPWDIIKEKYKVGQKLSGRVRSFTDFGAFVRLDEGVDALLHISDISWLKHIKHPSDVLKKGELIEAVIVNLEPEKEKMSVSIKDLTPDPWVSEIPNKYHLGDKVTGKIINISDSGLFVELDDGVEGLVYASKINKNPKKEVYELFKTGMRVDARVINIDSTRRRLGLSLEYY